MPWIYATSARPKWALFVTMPAKPIGKVSWERRVAFREPVEGIVRVVRKDAKRDAIALRHNHKTFASWIEVGRIAPNRSDGLLSGCRFAPIRLWRYDT